jgi:HD-GYP domain-containing protein (c-di-GMP phosphodiesterase class II)
VTPLDNKQLQSSKKFIIKDSTRKRCKIFPADEASLQQFRPISLELFSYLWEVPTIEFSIYIRVEEEMIEYIRAAELTKELLDHVYAASIREKSEVEVFIAKKDYPKFEHTLSYVRTRKINALLEKDPSLDRKTLEIFGDLSAASQMILRGGVNKQVAERVKSAAAFMVNQLMANDLAMSTLSKMITIDPTLYDHSASVAMFSTIMAKQYIDPRLPFKDAEVIAQCGLYHDAGKSCIPHAILNKPGAFTPDEFDVMKTHVQFGHKELMNAIENGAPIDEIVARVALEHHERFTGRGYPAGKRGRWEEDPELGIHVYSRIISIADAYSALLMKRVYKPALPAEKALELLERSAPDDFDPEIFQPFVAGVRVSLDALKKRKDVLEKNTGAIYMIDSNETLVKQIQETRKQQTASTVKKSS